MRGAAGRAAPRKTRSRWRPQAVIPVGVREAVLPCTSDPEVPGPFAEPPNRTTGVLRSADGWADRRQTLEEQRFPREHSKAYPRPGLTMCAPVPVPNADAPGPVPDHPLWDER